MAYRINQPFETLPCEQPCGLRALVERVQQLNEVVARIANPKDLSEVLRVTSDRRWMKGFEIGLISADANRPL